MNYAMLHPNSVWVGFQPAFGVLVYDPDMQTGVEHHHVRLCEARTGNLVLFERERVRGKLQSLRSYLASIGIVASAAQDAARNVAQTYIASPPQLPVSDWGEPELALSHDDYDRDRELLVKELMDDQDAWARSDEEGWFYEE